MLKPEDLKAVLETKPEIVVFYHIRSMGGFVWRVEHDMADGRIPESDWPAIDADVKTMRDELRQIVQSLTRFGLLLPTTEVGQPTEEYWKWYRRWDSYERSLVDSEYRQLEKAIETGADLSKWRPEDEEKEEIT